MTTAATMYDVLSPTKCADQCFEEILRAGLDGNEREIKRLIRVLVRDVYEHCAQLAEEYTAFNDLKDRLKGEEVGDAIAEMLRQVSEERSRERTLA